MCHASRRRSVAFKMLFAALFVLVPAAGGGASEISSPAPVCAAEHSGSLDPRLTELRPTLPGAWRQAERFAESPRRQPGEPVVAPKSSAPAATSTEGRWLPGYRPATAAAVQELEAWKARKDAAGAGGSGEIPNSPGSNYGTNLLNGTRAPEPPVEAIERIVRDERYLISTIDLRTIDWDEVATREPQQKHGGPPSDYHHGSGLTWHDYLTLKELAKSSPATLDAQPSPTGASAAPAAAGVAFDAIPSNLTSVPPDPIMAAGPGHLVAVVNTRYRVWDKSGVPLIDEIDLDTFFDGVPNCSGAFDVFVDYDEANDRFVMGAETVTQVVGVDSYLCVAATVTGDPTGAWNRVGFRADLNTQSTWIDFPHMGIGLDEIYVSGNMFGDAGGFDHTRLYAIDRDALYAGTPVTVAEANVGGLFFTAQPVKIHGFTSGGWPAPGTPHHFVSHDGGGNTRIWRWSDPFNSDPVVYGDVVEENFNGLPPSAPELGGTSASLNDTGSAKWLDAEYRGGRLWTARNVACDFGGGSSESCLDWIQVDVSGATPLLEQQQVGGAYGSADDFRYYPDLSVDRNNNVAIGYTKSSETTYTEVWVTGREFGDASGTLQAELLQRAGTGTYTDGAGCGGNCDRWGDYTGLTVDPDGCTFWYLGQFSDGGHFNWSTHIGSFRFDSCSVDSTLQVSAGTVTCDDSLEITVTDQTRIDAATVSAQTTLTTTGGDSETVPPGSWAGSDCVAADCGTWTATLAVSDAAGAVDDGTLNVSDAETITATYLDPHAGHADQSRDVAVACSTRVTDGGYLTDGGCEGQQGTELYRDYMDGGEYIAYTFGIFNPQTAPALTDVSVTLSISGPAADKITIFNPTLDIGALGQGSLNGPVFNLYIDPSIDTAGLRMSDHDFNLMLTSVADGYTTPQRLTQNHLLHADDNIVRESECWNFESGAQGFVSERYFVSYTCQAAEGCSTTQFVSSVEAPWTHGSGCGSETRTDHPDMTCDIGGSDAFMSNVDAGACNVFAQSATEITDDILYSPIFSPTNSGDAANGQPWFFDWQYAEWFYRADMVAGADNAMVAGFFWDDDYQGVTTPAVNEVDTLYSFFTGFFAYANQDWDSAAPWDPAELPRNLDGVSFAVGPRLSAPGLQWRWATEVYDADLGSDPEATPATGGLALDDMNFVYDQFHADEQIGTCSGASAVAAFDRYAYIECPSSDLGLSVFVEDAAGAARVTVTSLGSGDRETLLIAGDGPYFATTLPYSTGAGPQPNDGTLLIVPSDLLQLTYDDDPGSVAAFAFVGCEGGEVISEGVASLSDNGDGDSFADRNETVDISIRIRNNTDQELQNASVVIATNDPTIDCLIKDSASFGTIPAGGGTAVNDLASDPFTFKVAAQADCTEAAVPPIATFQVFVSADGFAGTSTPQQFTMILDLNELPGTITFSEDFSTDPVGFRHELGPGDDDRVAFDPNGFSCSSYVDEFFWGAAGGNPGGGYFLWQDPADSFPDGFYSDLNDSALISPVLMIGANGTTLSFDHEYRFGWSAGFRLDGVRVDYEVNGGAWQKLTTLPYDGGLIWNTYCNPLCNGTEFGAPCFAENPELGENVFNQLDLGTVDWTTVAGAIDGLEPGDLLRIRWRFGSMNTAAYGLSTQGGYGLDNVTLTNVVELVCDPADNPDAGCGVVFDSSGNLTEVCGDGDLLVEPTESWSVDVTLRNSATVDAVDTLADLALGIATPVGAAISNTTSSFGTIPAFGSTATASYEFVVDPAAVCVNDIVFDVLSIADASTSYPAQPAAFAVPVGGAGAQQIASQAVDPLVVANQTIQTTLLPTLTIPTAAQSASVTFSSDYTNITPQQVGLQDTTPLVAENNSVTTTLSPPFTFERTDAVSAIVDWGSLTHERVEQCTRVYLRTPAGFNLTLKAVGEVAANPYDVLPIYSNLNGGPGQYQIGLEEVQSGPCKMTATISDVTMTVSGPTTIGSWTSSTQVALWDGSAEHVLKQFGQSDAQPYDVTAIYNAAGPGTYRLRVTESGDGGTATVSGATLDVVGVECEPGCSSFVSPPPPVADGITGTGIRLAKGGSPDEFLFTFDNATCSSDHAVILYGSLSDFSGYQGVVSSGCDAGAGPTATVTHAGANVWFNVLWVNQIEAAGSAGSSSTGQRSWPATGFCGVLLDDSADAVCD